MTTPSTTTLTGKPLNWRTAPHHFLAHLVVMPRWHKLVIVFAGAAALLGTVGQIVARVNRPPPAAPAAVQPEQRATPSGPGGSSFVSESDHPADSTSPAQPAPQPAAAPDDSMLARLSPHATKIGLSIVLGFIVGWLCRAFLKLMALVALLVVGGLWLLSHFGILHLAQSDVDAMRQKSEEAATWLQQHARLWKDAAIAHLPSTGGGAFGAFLGFRRKR